jgi:malonate-semialdehyde dehydrogenase (acetylating)/methylmalonate-semialdehyde dehydrogenase
VQGKDGIDFFTQNKIATVRIAPPSGQFLRGGESEEEIKKIGKAQKVRSCVAT